MHSSITVVDGDELSDIQTPISGLAASRALSTNQATLLRIELQPDSAADWRCHPGQASYGVVRAGRLGITSQKDGLESTTEASVGDCFRVPPGVDHQLETVGDEPVVALVALVGSGSLFEPVDEPQSTSKPPQVASPDGFISTAQLKNLTRLTPFPDAPVQQVVGHADGQITSEWHHHGDNDVFGYVIRGVGYVDTGDADPELATAGSFFHIPAGVVHRDVNPTDDEQDYLLWLTGSDPRIVYQTEP